MTDRTLSPAAQAVLDAGLLHVVHSNELVRGLMDAMGATAAALAQPEPQGHGPTDDELQKAADAMRDEDDTLSLVEYARTVLSRWGRPAIEPVPVSERLPGPEDCDAEGRCWVYDQGDTFTAPAWNLENKADLQDLKQMQNEGKLIGLCERWRLAWLPHWALPVPKSEVHNG